MYYLVGRVGRYDGKKIDRQIDKRRVTSDTKIHSKNPTGFKIIVQLLNDNQMHAMDKWVFSCFKLKIGININKLINFCLFCINLIKMDDFSELRIRNIFSIFIENYYYHYFEHSFIHMWWVVVVGIHTAFIYTICQFFARFFFSGGGMNYELAAWVGGWGLLSGSISKFCTIIGYWFCDRILLILNSILVFIDTHNNTLKTKTKRNNKNVHKT